MVAYASSFSSGQCGVVVVNKAGYKQVVKLQLNNFAGAKSYYRFVLTGGTDNGNFSRKVFVNGNGPSGDGGGPDNYASLKALGTAVIGDLKFEAPPLSVTYLLVTGDSIPDITGIEPVKGASFNLFPNPTKGNLTIENTQMRIDHIEFLDLNGRKLFSQNPETREGQPLKLNLKLPKGIYVVKVVGNKQQFSKMLVVD